MKVIFLSLFFWGIQADAIETVALRGNLSIQKCEKICIGDDNGLADFEIVLKGDQPSGQVKIKKQIEKTDYLVDSIIVVEKLPTRYEVRLTVVTQSGSGQHEVTTSYAKVDRLENLNAIYLQGPTFKHGGAKYFPVLHVAAPEMAGRKSKKEKMSGVAYKSVTDVLVKSI